MEPCQAVQCKSCKLCHDLSDFQHCKNGKCENVICGDCDYCCDCKYNLGISKLCVKINPSHLFRDYIRDMKSNNNIGCDFCKYKCYKKENGEYWTCSYTEIDSKCEKIVCNKCDRCYKHHPIYCDRCDVHKVSLSRCKYKGCFERICEEHDDDLCLKHFVLITGFNPHSGLV
jgi:hypothetical protein